MTTTNTPTIDLTMAIIIVIVLYIFSSGFCMYVANKKGQKIKYWGIMGLIFGPGAILAILFTNTDVVHAQTPESFEERVKYYLDLGLLDSKDFEGIKTKIRRKYIEEWGNDLDNNVVIDDLHILFYGSKNVWWKDTEADVLNGNNIYVRTLEEWGNISKGTFLPTKITEKWESDEGMITLEFRLNDKTQKFHPKYLDDYIDIELLKLINNLISTSESKFELLKAFDQTAFVIWLNKKEKKDLIRRGWRFSW